MKKNAPVTIFGIDFTSAPSSRKPITCACAKFDGVRLCLDALVHIHNFVDFETLLETPGTWVAGMDFPFGQSRRLIKNIGWPESWGGYVREASQLDRNGFKKALEDYKRHRPPGDKQHKRACDVLTRSQSPQTLYGTPVALMFYEGARRLLDSGVHIPFNHDGDKSRVVLEAYPGVAVRRLIGNRSYKNDTKRKQTVDQQRSREEIMVRLTGKEAESIYGFSVDAPFELANDPGADDLDALICAVQAAWGYIRAEHGYGAPIDVDRLEGWISDPALNAA